MTTITQEATTTELERLRFSSALSTTFFSRMFSALTAMTFREKGEAAANKLWFEVLTNHQGDRYAEGLRKLGIHDDPPAVAAAKYHYFTNIIGGLDMEYVEESPKKAWVRYRAPMWMYAGVAMIAMPASVRRTVFSSWHPRNGKYMNCPQLGYVGTKFSMEGDPYDEGYFIEYDHDIDESQTMRYETVLHTPEFDPETAPKLDPVLWPEERILKARPKFSAGYVQATVDSLYETYGEFASHQIVASASRLLAVQLTPELAATAGVPGRSVADIATFHERLLTATRRDARVTKVDERTYRLEVGSYHPFDESYPQGLRQAFFEFHSAATRMLNGHVEITRTADGDGEAWQLTDTGRWLW
ncbi:hypothetical protein [Saccharopolyspora pogona]|uniref:hypothetical protein n=1 Tax=Saccharopolyspora pogona TaxID=333966 RepID=UPI00168997D7|nr:hypothetical protein [Saccharopolyspora pogona]